MFSSWTTWRSVAAGVGNEVGHAHRPVEARQFGGQVLEHELQEKGVAFRVVAADERGGKLAEVLIRGALPPACHHGRSAQRLTVGTGRLHQPKNHQPVQQRVRRLLFGLAPEILGRLRFLALRRSRILSAELFGDPRLEPGSPRARLFAEARIARPHRKAVDRLSSRMQIVEQPSAQRPDGRRERTLGVRRHRHRFTGPR